MPVGGNVAISTSAIVSRSNLIQYVTMKATSLTQDEDLSPHSHPGKEQGMCYLESYWPSIRFHTLLSCKHDIKLYLYNTFHARSQIMLFLGLENHSFDPSQNLRT